MGSPERVRPAHGQSRFSIRSHPDRLTDFAEAAVLSRDGGSSGDQHSDLYGDGQAASRIVETLAELALRDTPDLIGNSDERGLRCVHPR